MKKCPYCAEEIQDEATYCRWCKHDLLKIQDGMNRFTGKDNLEKLEFVRPKKRGWGWMIFILLVVFGVIFYLGKTVNIDASETKVCTIRQKDQPFEISIQGDNITSECLAILRNNETFYSTSENEDLTSICSFQIAARQIVIRDQYESAITNVICDTLRRKDSTQSLSLPDLLSLITELEDIPQKTSTPLVLHITPTILSDIPFKPIPWLDLVNFISFDHTNWNAYDINSYNCLDYAIDLVANARKEGMDVWIVGVDFEGQESGHAFVAFRTTDKGVVYVEPQRDYTYSNLKVGNWLCDDWGKDTCMGVVKTIEQYSRCDHKTHECFLINP